MQSSQNQQDFYEHVWRYVRTVPRGSVVTYGQIAQAVPTPQSEEFEQMTSSPAQQVGSAMAACPADVPWHRVINAQGKVSSRTDAQRQQQLLEAEGLVFVQGKIDLEEYQWLGPDQAKRPKQQALF